MCSSNNNYVNHGLQRKKTEGGDMYIACVICSPLSILKDVNVFNCFQTKMEPLQVLLKLQKKKKEAVSCTTQDFADFC
jgi:hypothetical protein